MPKSIASQHNVLHIHRDKSGEQRSETDDTGISDCMDNWTDLQFLIQLSRAWLLVLSVAAKNRKLHKKPADSGAIDCCCGCCCGMHRSRGAVNHPLVSRSAVFVLRMEST